VLTGAQDGIVERLTALERPYVQICPVDMRRAAYLAELGQSILPRPATINSLLCSRCTCGPQRRRRNDRPWRGSNR
jgi:hypothetical protein